MVDQDAAHHLRGDGEEMCAICYAILGRQPQVASTLPAAGCDGSLAAQICTGPSPELAYTTGTKSSAPEDRRGRAQEMADGPVRSSMLAACRPFLTATTRSANRRPGGTGCSIRGFSMT